MGSRLVKLEDVSPGVRVVKDVMDAKGTLLFKAGVELSRPMIERILARNITHVFIEQDDGPGLSEADLDAKQGEIDGEIDAIFSDVADLPLMTELREAAKRYLKEKAGT